MDDATGTASGISTPQEATTALVNSVSALAKLMADEALLAEKIGTSQVALAAVKKKISEFLVQSYVTQGPNITMPEELMSQEQYYERLLLALEEMRRELTQKIRPLELQIIEANREHLRESFDFSTRRLNRCLEKIDEKTLACRQYLEEYDSIRAELQRLNEKLEQLGAVHRDLPSVPASSDLGEMIMLRLQHLRSLGKI